MKTKAVYTMRELAGLTGLTPKQTRKLLQANAVPLRPLGQGTQRLSMCVLLTDIRESLPDLWDSILLARDVRSTASR